MKWGRLINAALDCGLEGEDALWAVLYAAARLQHEGHAPLLSGPELRALDAVGEHGSYAAAAVELGQARSTVHRYTKIAARKLGVPMCDAPAEALRRGLLEAA